MIVFFCFGGCWGSISPSHFSLHTTVDKHFPHTLTTTGSLDPTVSHYLHVPWQLVRCGTYWCLLPPPFQAGLSLSKSQPITFMWGQSPLKTIRIFEAMTLTYPLLGGSRAQSQTVAHKDKIVKSRRQRILAKQWCGTPNQDFANRPITTNPKHWPGWHTQVGRPG